MTGLNSAIILIIAGYFIGIWLARAVLEAANSPTSALGDRLGFRIVQEEGELDLAAIIWPIFLACYLMVLFMKSAIYLGDHIRRISDG